MAHPPPILATPLDGPTALEPIDPVAGVGFDVRLGAPAGLAEWFGPIPVTAPSGEAVGECVWHRRHVNPTGVGHRVEGLLRFASTPGGRAARDLLVGGHLRLSFDLRERPGGGGLRFAAVRLVENPASPVAYAERTGALRASDPWPTAEASRAPSEPWMSLEQKRAAEAARQAAGPDAPLPASDAARLAELVRSGAITREDARRLLGEALEMADPPRGTAAYAPPAEYVNARCVAAPWALGPPAPRPAAPVPPAPARPAGPVTPRAIDLED